MKVQLFDGRYTRIVSSEHKTPHSLLVDTPGQARKTMTRTRQTKGSTSSESSAFDPVFAPSATKLQETCNKMSSTLEQRDGN